MAWLLLLAGSLVRLVKLVAPMVIRVIRVVRLVVRLAIRLMRLAIRLMQARGHGEYCWQSGWHSKHCRQHGVLLAAWLLLLAASLLRLVQRGSTVWTAIRLVGRLMRLAIRLIRSRGHG